MVGSLLGLHKTQHSNKKKWKRKETIMQQAMLDIETLGVNPGCIVLSIGVVVFENDHVVDQLHVKIDPLDSEKHGLIAEASTVMWWLDQSKKAQEALTEGNFAPLKTALEKIAGFRWADISRVWANGASFDFPILKAAFNAAGMQTPWPYYAEMDYRTFKKMFDKDIYKRNKIEPATGHDALADATAQALTMINLIERGEKWVA